MSRATNLVPETVVHKRYKLLGQGTCPCHSGTHCRRSLGQSRTCSVQRSKWRSCDGDHRSRDQPIYETWRPYLAPLLSALRMRALGMWFVLSYNLLWTAFIGWATCASCRRSK